MPVATGQRSGGRVEIVSGLKEGQTVVTRGAFALRKCSRTLAAAQARTFVTADDVKSVAHAVMEHRMLLTPQAELSGVRTEDLVERTLNSIEAPGAVRAAN